MCDICGMNFRHDPRCPYYTEPISNKTCVYCNSGIYPGEVYIDNDFGESIHKDCALFTDIDWLIDWLKIDYKIMEE